jgi:flagellar basal body rod protein FlgB
MKSWVCSTLTQLRSVACGAILRLQNISGNIANSQTTAYKSIETNFGSDPGRFSAHAPDRRGRDRKFARHE